MDPLVQIQEQQANKFTVPFIFYGKTIQIIQVSGWYNLELLCNGFTVTNIGTTIVTVDQEIYYPGVPGVSLGDSRTFGGNLGEIYRGGPIQVSFAAGAGSQISIIQKVYVKMP